MEKEGYRDQLALIREIFPDRITITPVEAARVLGWDIKTVRAALTRRVNPLPSQQQTRARLVISITAEYDMVYGDALVTARDGFGSFRDLDNYEVRKAVALLTEMEI